MKIVGNGTQMMTFGTWAVAIREQLVLRHLSKMVSSKIEIEIYGRCVSVKKFEAFLGE